jgi:hypothetical protein
MWKLVPTDPSENNHWWVDSERLHTLILKAKSSNGQKPPPKNIPRLASLHSFTPSSTLGWSTDVKGFVGRAASVILTDQHSQESISAAKKSKKKILPHERIIEARHDLPQSCQYWGRTICDPSISVLLTDEQLTADAVDAHDVARRSLFKTRTHHTPTFSSDQPQPLEPSQGDFTSSTTVGITPTWTSTLDSALSGIPAERYRALEAGSYSSQ